MIVQVVKGVSKKTGKEYVCLDIHINDRYIKRVFLDPAEQALVLIENNI